MEQRTKYSAGDFAVIAALVIFYTVGIVGFELPLTHPLFVKLTPLALILSVLVLLRYDNGWKNRKFGWFALFVFAGSYLIEVIGVNTGMIFGAYSYGEGLSVKLLGTPLMIGLNWILMVYLTSAVVSALRRNFAGQVLLPSVLMVAYDGIMEQVAHRMDMWQWAGGSIPLQNYLIWGIMAVAFHSVKNYTAIEIKNKMALPILLIQSVFFLLIWII